jgi:hypothetical protein
MHAILVDGVLYIPKRIEDPATGFVGDGMVPIDKTDPDYDMWLDDAKYFEETQKEEE